MTESPRPDPARLADTEAMLLRDLAPVRPLRPWRVTLYLGLVAIAACAMALVMGRMLMGAPALALHDALPLGGAVLLSVAAYAFAVRLAIPAAAPAPIAWALPLAAPIAVMVLAALTSRSVASGASHAGGALCLFMTSGLALIPTTAAFFALRSLIAVAPWRAGAALALAGGTLAALATELLCRDTTPTHLAVAHGGAIALVTLVASLGWHALARRRLRAR